MQNQEHVSAALRAMAEDLAKRRDMEISMAAEVAVQYVHDHNDRTAYCEIDREVGRLAKAWDKMIVKLDKWADEAEKIEASCENFYGD